MFYQFVAYLFLCLGVTYAWSDTEIARPFRNFIAKIPYIHKEILFQKKMINIFLFLNALAVLFIFIFNNALFLQGLGIGLFIQSLIVITANYFAAQRSQIYLKWLNDYYN